MKHLLTLILLSVGLQVSAQVTPLLPAGATSYSSQIYRKISGGDTTYYTGATGKGFLKLAGYADVLRLQDSLANKANKNLSNVSGIPQSKITGLVDSLTAKAGKNLLNVSKATVTGKVDSATFRTVANSLSLAGIQTRLNAYQLLLSGTGIVKSTSGTISYLTDNSTNWNTAYTYSQVGHLPLSGGTLTGVLSGTAGTFSGNISGDLFLGSSGYRFNFSGTNRGGIYGYTFLSGSGTDYTPTLFAETGFGLRMFVDGGLSKGFSILPNGQAVYTSLSGSGDVVVGADNNGGTSKITIGSGLSLTSGVLTATGGSSGSVTTSGGTAGKIVKFTSASNVENSILTESSSLISVAGAVNSFAHYLIQGGSTRGGLYTYNSIVGSGTDYSLGLYSEGDLFLSASGSTAKLLTLTSTSGVWSIPISATSYSGAGTGLTGTASALNIGGNSGTTTALQTARTIAGVSFDGTANISLNNNAITNGAGYITGISSGDVTTALGYTPTSVTGLTGVQSVGAFKNGLSLGNVDNTSDATKNSAVATLTNKTLTSPVITNPTGIDYSDLSGTPTIPTNTNQLTNGAGFITGNQSITLSGAVTGSGTTAITTTLASGIDATKLADGTVTSTELQYINSLTSNAQTQIDAKANTSSLATVATTGAYSDLTGTPSLASYITASSTNTLTNKSGAISQWTNDAGYKTSVSSGDVTGALGYTPYNATNPNGYISSINSGNVTTALGYTPTSITGLTGVQSASAIKTGLSLTKSDVGLGSVDNTSDAGKPISTAQQTALDLKENLSNKSTSTSLGTSNTLYPTQNAVKTYVDAQVSAYGIASSGSITLSGNGSTTDFNTTLQLTAGQRMVLTPASADAAQFGYWVDPQIGCSGTCEEFHIRFNTAPITGTNNVKFNYIIF